MSETTLPSSKPFAESAEARDVQPTAAVVAAIATGLFLTMVPVTLMVAPLKELVGDRFGVGSFWTHAFMSMNLLGAIAFAPLAGAISDRSGSRRAMLAAALTVDATLFLGLAMAPNFATFMAIRFFEGAAHVTAVSTWMALASDWADPKHRGRMMGTVGAALTFGVAFGAPMGGILVRGGEAQVVLFAGAGLTAIAAAFAWACVREPARHGPGEALGAGWSLLRREPALWVPCVYTLIDRFTVGVIISSVTLYLAEVMGLSPAQRGGMMAAVLFPYALLCYPVGRLSDRWGRAKLMIAGSALYGFNFALLGWASGGMLLAVLIAAGVLSAVMAAPTLALCSDLAPAAERAAAFGMFNALGSVGFLLGPIFGGAIVQIGTAHRDALTAFRATFIAAGAVEILCAAATIPLLLRLIQARRTR